ncbi:type IV pilin protein [Rheinheimera mesophila]|nr:type IV pilin protein [Rheinheimera mesophila]
MNKFYDLGFSLIELMIAITVAGILFAIALPAYQDYIMVSRRADAVESLFTLSQQLERQFTQSNSYTGLSLATSSSGGFYTISAEITDTAFTLTATATGAQSADSLCSTFTLNQRGEKGGSNPQECW